MRHVAAIAACAASLFALPVRAELIEVDLFAPGDQLVTRDTETGLDWLEVGVTTNLSFDAIEAGAGGWIAAGWRHPTQAEVCGLLAHGSGVGACIYGGITFQRPDAFYEILLGLGPIETIPTGLGQRIRRLTAYYEDDVPGDGFAGVAVVEIEEFDSPPAVFPAWRTRSDLTGPQLSFGASPEYGNFLVRASPPVVPAVPPFGFAALAALLVFAARVARPFSTHPRGVSRRDRARVLACNR